MSATWYTKAGADAQFATQAALALKADASGLAAVATSGSYADLANTPTIPAAQVQTDWNAASGMGAILNKPALFSGAYTDLTGKPTLGTAAAQDVTAFATAAQGTKADSAVQPAALASYATTAALTSGLAGKVATTTTVNGKALSANITLAAADVGALTQTTADGRYATTAQGAKADTAVQPAGLAPYAQTVNVVPNTRTVNGKPLSADVTLSASDVGARASTWTPGLADQPAGSTLTVLSSGGAWPARPTSRTDMFVVWVDAAAVGTNPPGAITGDQVVTGS